MQQTKKIAFLCQIQNYLRNYPAPTAIDHYQDIFKLIYTFSSPYTDSKNSKEVFYIPSNISNVVTISNSNKKLIHNLQKGRLEENNSFDSVMTKDKHEQLLQDDVFGKPQISKDGSKWVYIAEIKQKQVKSYFNQGSGKLPYKHDFGENYENVKEVGIFIWDKTKKKVFRVQINDHLIPCCPSFSNSQATEIIFHAYERQHFGHGLIFCFNRSIKIMKSSYTFAVKPKQQNSQSNNKNNKQELQLKAETVELFMGDLHKTKIFPKISPCLKYLVYISGTGDTHTFYSDFVICENREGYWIEIHRLKELIIGYHSIFKNYFISQNQKQFAITQTFIRGSSQILKINLQTAEIIYLTKDFINHSFQITNFSQNTVLGLVNTNNFNSFFYIKEGGLSIIQPQKKQEFIQQSYDLAIHSLLVYAKKQHILPEYQSRVEKRPLVVMPHGGPHSTFANGLTCLRYVLLKMGYYLLHPNFSGSIGYGKQSVVASLGKIGEKDANEIIETLKKVLDDHPDIDRTKVHTQGGSYGGFMSAIFASRYSEYFKSAVIMNGVLNIAANLWFSDIPEWNIVQSLASSNLNELKQEDYLAMWRQSPTTQPMKIPILQFLGAKDRRVPWRQGLLFDAITKANNVKITTYLYQNSGHSLSDSVETTIDIAVKTIAFFQSFMEQNPANEVKEQIKE